MKKIITLCFAAFLMCNMAIAQETASNTDENTVKKTNCVPTIECAEKMGITLEQCKAICEKHSKTNTSANSSSTDTQTKVLASLEENGSETNKAKSCSPAKSAATVETSKGQCKSHAETLCGGKTKTASTTSVASAIKVSEPPPAKPKEAKCATAVKACSKKIVNQY